MTFDLSELWCKTYVVCCCVHPGFPIRSAAKQSDLCYVWIDPGVRVSLFLHLYHLNWALVHICESVPSLYPFIWYLKCFSIFPKTYLLTKYPGFYSAHFLSKHEESFLCFCWWIKLNGALMCVFLVIWHTGRRTLWSIFMWHAETASMCLVSTSFRPFRTSSITSLTSLCWAVTQVHTTACSHMK